MSVVDTTGMMMGNDDDDDDDPVSPPYHMLEESRPECHRRHSEDQQPSAPTEHMPDKADVLTPGTPSSTVLGAIEALTVMTAPGASCACSSPRAALATQRKVAHPSLPHSPVNPRLRPAPSSVRRNSSTRLTAAMLKPVPRVPPSPATAPPGDDGVISDSDGGNSVGWAQDEEVACDAAACHPYASAVAEETSPSLSMSLPSTPSLPSICSRRCLHDHERHQSVSPSSPLLPEPSLSPPPRSHSSRCTSAAAARPAPKLRQRSPSPLAPRPPSCRSSVTAVQASEVVYLPHCQHTEPHPDRDGCAGLEEPTRIATTVDQGDGRRTPLSSSVSPALDDRQMLDYMNAMFVPPSEMDLAVADVMAAKSLLTQDAARRVIAPILQRAIPLPVPVYADDDGSPVSSRHGSECAGEDDGDRDEERESEPSHRRPPDDKCRRFPRGRSPTSSSSPAASRCRDSSPSSCAMYRGHNVTALPYPVQLQPRPVATAAVPVHRVSAAARLEANGFVQQHQQQGRRSESMVASTATGSEMQAAATSATAATRQRQPTPRPTTAATRETTVRVPIDCTFDDMLATPVLVSHFLRFLVVDTSFANWEFCTAIDRCILAYTEDESLPGLMATFRNLYRIYVSPTGHKSLNFDANQVHDATLIVAGFKVITTGDYVVAHLRRLQMAIEETLRRDCFPRFLSSPRYKAALRAMSAVPASFPESSPPPAIRGMGAIRLPSLKIHPPARNGGGGGGGGGNTGSRPKTPVAPTHATAADSVHDDPDDNDDDDMSGPSTSPGRASPLARRVAGPPARFVDAESLCMRVTPW